jgi:hypothetical protein
VARPRRRVRSHPKSGEARGDGDQSVVVGDTQGSREEFVRVGRRRELAEGGAHRGGGNGGRANSVRARAKAGVATYSRGMHGGRDRFTVKHPARSMRGTAAALGVRARRE